MTIDFVPVIFCAIFYAITIALIHYRNPGMFRNFFFVRVPAFARWAVTDIPGKLDACVDFVGATILWCGKAVLWLIGAALALAITVWLFSSISWFALVVGFAVFAVVGTIQDEGAKTRDAINRRHDHDYY